DQQVVDRDVGEIAVDRGPIGALVGAAIDVGGVLVEAVAGEGDVDHVGIERVGGEAGDPAHRESGGDVGPQAAGVGGAPHFAVGGADVIDARAGRRNLQRRQRAGVGQRIRNALGHVAA